jgi:hypothetical protein
MLSDSPLVTPIFAAISPGISGHQDWSSDCSPEPLSPPLPGASGHDCATLVDQGAEFILVDGKKR